MCPLQKKEKDFFHEMDFFSSNGVIPSNELGSESKTASLSFSSGGSVESTKRSMYFSGILCPIAFVDVAIDKVI